MTTGYPTRKSDPHTQYVLITGGRNMRKLKLKGLTTAEADALNLGANDRAILWNNTTTRLEKWDGSSRTALGGATITFCDTEAFNANSPNTWADLDLSSIVGSNNALVMLRIKNNGSSGASNYQFRENGRSEDTGGGLSWASGLGNIYLSETKIDYTIVKTDSSGVIEWEGSDADSTTLHVIAYIK